MAKKFFFKLEPVYKLKSQREKIEKKTLLELTAARYKKEIEIEKRKSVYARTGKLSAGFSKAGDLQFIAGYKNSLRLEIEKLESERLSVIELENLQRKRYNEALKEKKVFSKLKEKRRERYLEELSREETKFLDEISRFRTSDINFNPSKDENI